MRGRCPVCGMATGERDPFRRAALPDRDGMHWECALAAGRQARPLAA